MGEVNYKPLIDEMVWSFSRLETFDDCPYRWFLTYIKHCEETDQFYTTYGLFMHKLIEQYYHNIITKEEMMNRFLVDFRKEVRGIRPAPSTVEKYIQCGCDYLQSFEPFKYKMVDIEKEVFFNINGLPFRGFIDYIGEENGEYIIIDHKSRALKPRSHQATPTLNDKTLDKMLRQLYLYAAAVEQEYGKLPKLLCFNCFRSRVFIEEPFNESAYNEAIEWANKQVETISEETDFHPYIDYFSCKFICGMQRDCIYYR